MASDSGIQYLPDEVLTHILSFVSPYNGLHNAAQVSKQFRRCVQEVVRRKKSNFLKAVKQKKLIWTKAEFNEDKKLMISRRYSHSAVYDETDNNPSIFIFGGCTSTSTTFNDLWRLDPTTREWSRPLATGAYPSPKACATLVKSKPGELMLFGGWTHPSPYPLHQSWRLFNELHTYDIPTSRWNLINPASDLKPPTMAGHSASVHHGNMIIFGGLQKQRHSVGQFSSSNDVWSFDIEAQTWTQKDIPEPRPKPRYGQSQLYLDEDHILILGGCGGPSNVYHDIWLLIMKTPHWKWVQCEVKNPEHAADNMWCHPACKVGNYAIILGKNIHPKNPDAKEKEDIHRKERWNFIPQARRGVNRGYGAIRRHHHPSPELQPQRNSPYAPPASRSSPSRLKMRFQDDDTEDSSTPDDAEMEDEDDVKLAVDPVDGPSSSGASGSRPPPVFRSSVTLNVNQDEPMPSTSRGACALPIRRPLPRMAAFSVSPTRRNPDEPPLAKRKQIETRQRQLDSLKKIEDRYRNLQREEEVKAKEPKLSNEQPKTHHCPCHKLSMFILDISKAISHNEVEWLKFWSSESLDSPEVAILYSLIEGRGELIMFGGIRKIKPDTHRNANQQPFANNENRDNSENDSVSNALYFLNAP